MPLVRFGIERKMIRYFDWSILLVVFILTGLSVSLLASVMTKPYTGGDMGFMAAYGEGRINFMHAARQALWFGTGLVLLIAVQLFDYKILGELTHYIYWINIAMLVLMLFLKRAGGSSGLWLRISENTSIQPSEFGKVAIIITFAHRLARRERPIETILELLPEIAYVGLPVALIILQGDFGTAMVYVGIFFGMLFLSGTSLKMIIGMIGVGAASIVPVWMVLDTYQRNRITTFLGLASVDATNEGYQITQSLRAIGSGQLTGKGLFNQATLAQQEFLPVRLSDFIFSSVGETMGFIGCAVVIGLYVFLLFRMLRISMKARDSYGALIAGGVMFMFLTHIFENIAMTINMMPMTGIPLPFLSAGGTSFWANMIAVGFVLSVGMRRPRGMFRM